jgi:hypothetical protein
MNGKLIFQLSLFGLAMAIATVYFIPSDIAPLFWLIIIIISAYLIAKNCTEKYFLHGLLVSILNSVWVTSIHIILIVPFMANNPREAEMMAKMPMPDSPRLMMLMTGPVVGVIFGIILGLFAFAASKIVKKK